MLGLSTVEFFGRLIPEVLILIFAAYSFSKTKIDCKKYTISVIVLATCVFIIRKSPINYGVHTILNIIALTVVATSINKIEIIGAIRSSIITTILLFALEGINVILLQITVADKLDAIVANSTLKTIYTLPSIISLALIVYLYYNIMKRNDKLKNV